MKVDNRKRLTDFSNKEMEIKDEALLTNKTASFYDSIINADDKDKNIFRKQN